MAGALCPVLVGRSDELEALRRALERAASGHGSVTFLLGEAGVGKSRLARELAGEGVGRNALVLRGRAMPGPRAEPFGPLAMALGSVAEELRGDEASLGPWMPALSCMVPGLGTRTGAPVDETSAARGEATVRALQSLGTGRGVLLVLEDLHWADADTLAVLEHLSDNLDRAPALCVVTVRSETESPARALAYGATSRRSAELHHLRRLSDDEVRAMVRACDTDVDHERVDRVVDTAEGVPFLVEELLASPGVPVSFATAVERRLATMAPATRLVLQVAATFGRSFDWRLTGPAAGVDEATVRVALEAGVAAQLLALEGGQLRFRHALTSDAIVASLLPPQRAALARAALDALMDSPDQLDGLRRELAGDLAAKAGNDALAGQLLLQSGRAARDAGALGTAGSALDRAWSLLPPGDDRDRAGDALLGVLVDTGRVDDALELARQLLPTRAGAEAATVHLDAARAAVAGARWAEAAAHLDRAAAVAPGDVPTLRARTWALQAEIELGSEQPEAAAHSAQRALDGATAAGESELACSAYLLLGRCERLSSLDRAHDSFERALMLAEAESLPLWRMRALHELGTLDMLDRGRLDRLSEARRAAEALGAHATIAVLDLELAAGASMTFDLEALARHATAAASLAGQLGLREVEAAAHVFLALLGAMHGDVAATMAAARAATAAAPDHAQTRALALLECEGILALALGDRARALTAMEAGDAILRDARAAAPSSGRGVWPLLLAVEGRQEARSALEELRAGGATVNRLNLGYSEYAEAVLCGHHDAERAAGLVGQGDANLAHGPFWLHLGRGLVARAALADGWGQPARWLDEAVTWFAAHGCDVLADSVRAQRPPPSEVPSSWSHLGVSAREAEVLRLLIEGCTNKEIAAQLYVSARTVEKHVEALLRKTGTRSRTQLARVATQS